jgi:hypothetical protein
MRAGPKRNPCIAIELGVFPRAVQGRANVSTRKVHPKAAQPAPQPHAHRTYVSRHHDAGVVHPQPNEPHDPEEPVPVDQPHARRTYVPRHHDAGVVHPQPNEPHDPEESVSVDQPHADETPAIEPLASPTLERHLRTLSIG